jgi:hypothetical protein
MAGMRERIVGELQSLVKEGAELYKATVDAKADKRQVGFLRGYHRWYTRALGVVRHLIPDRETDFRRLYDRDTRRKQLDFETYTLEDYVQALGPPQSWGTEEFDVHAAALLKFLSQLEILRSAESRISDTLANIRGVLQADLFDSELDAARHLSDNGHLRAAGAVAGVVLESHLAEVCSQHGVAVRKKAPHISDYNDALKNAGVLDIVQWRGVQRLTDIRNLCDHKKQRDPTPDEVEELINGVDKAVKTLA